MKTYLKPPPIYNSVDQSYDPILKWSYIFHPTYYLPIGSTYGTFAHIWLIFMVYVGKHTSPMDPMGYNWWLWAHFAGLFSVAYEER